VLISYRTAYAIAWGAERLLKLLHRKDHVISTDAIFLSNVFRGMDSSKARHELGWSPRPISETVRDAVNWFAAHDNEVN